MSVIVQPSSVGGLGLFSCKKFKAGDIIIIEQPLLLVRKLEWEDMSAAHSDESESSKRIRDGIMFCAIFNFWPFADKKNQTDRKLSELSKRKTRKSSGPLRRLRDMEIIEQRRFCVIKCSYIKRF